MSVPALSSPCIKVCAIDGETGWCLGCGRTLQEVAAWVKLGPDGRQAVDAALPERMDTLKALGKLGPQT
ncbi:MAG: DUF1289 domain-containing protein [Pseudomonadota bacterium]